MTLRKKPQHQLGAPGNNRLAEQAVEAIWPLLDALDAYLSAHDGHFCGLDCNSSQEQYADLAVLRIRLLNEEALTTSTMRPWHAYCRRNAELASRPNGNRTEAAIWRRIARRYTMRGRRRREGQQ